MKLQKHEAIVLYTLTLTESELEDIATWLGQNPYAPPNKERISKLRGKLEDLIEEIDSE